MKPEKLIEEYLESGKAKPRALNDIIIRYSDLVEMIEEAQEKAQFMPERLTAENGAKALLLGEFYESVTVDSEDEEEVYHIRVPVKWTTIKDMYKTIVKHFKPE